MTDEELSLLRDPQAEADAILDHLSACLILLQAHPRGELYEAVERAWRIADANTTGSVAGRHH
ncbi:hypothetical protein [Breoghania corrubedonensis]|uniref:hypothetical protein n=1 Tax=Breoghania corrubedonensis TaxID=665038 RepID=UPI0011B1F316|nr:hypothetical protein [Breoghania corrubedonensis]